MYETEQELAAAIIERRSSYQWKLFTPVGDDGWAFVDWSRITEIHAAYESGNDPYGGEQ